MASDLRNFVDAARAEGYNDDELSEHLRSTKRTFGKNQPIGAAFDEGYNLDEIMDYHEGKSESFWKDDVGGGLTAAGKMLQRGWEEIKFKNRATGDEFHPRNYLSDEQKEGIREKYMTDPETFGDSGWLLENVLTPEQKAQRDADIGGDSKMTEYLAESDRLGKEAEEARSLAAVNDRWSAAGMIANATEVTGRMAPAIAAGLVTRSASVSLSLLGTDVFGNELATGREMGLDETTATRRAFLMAGSEVLTETVPVLGFLGKLGGKGVGSRILRSAMSESGEEAIATYVQTGLDAGLYEEGASLQNALEKLSSMETLEEAGYAMLLGGGVGAALGTPGAFKSVRDEAKQLNQVNKLREESGIAEYETVSKELNNIRKKVAGPDYNKLPEEEKQALEKELLEKEYQWSQVHLKTADAQKEILDLVGAPDEMYEKLSWDTAWSKNNEQADRYANARMRAVLDSAPEIEQATAGAARASQDAAPLQTELGTFNSIRSGETLEDPAIYDDLIEKKYGKWTSNKKTKFILTKAGRDYADQLETQVDNLKGAAEKQTEEAKISALKSTGLVTEELADEDYMDETITEETYPEVPEQVTDEDYMDEVVTDRAYPEQADVTDQDYPPLAEQEVTDQDYPEVPDYETPRRFTKAEDLPAEIDYLDSTSRQKVMEDIEEDAKPWQEKRDLTPEGIARRAAWDKLSDDEKFKRTYYEVDFPGVQNKRAYVEDTTRNPTKVQGFLDIDNLGWANDNLGQKKDQDTGDKYIRKVLKAVMQQQKSSPEIELYRYGGDEFMITAPTKASGESFLADVEKRLSTYKPVTGKDGSTLQPTITWGVARQREVAMARAGAKKKAKVERGEAAPKGETPFTYTPPPEAPTGGAPLAMRDRGGLPSARDAMQPYELGRRIRELGERLELFGGQTIADALRQADAEKAQAFYAWIDQSNAELIDGIRQLTEMYEGLTETETAVYEERAKMWRVIANNPELTAQQAFMIERSGYLSNILSDAEPRSRTHPVNMIPSMRKNASGAKVKSVLDSAFAERIRQVWETQQEGDISVIPDSVVEDLVASSEKWNDILQKDLTSPADQLINRLARWAQFDSANKGPHPFDPNVEEYKKWASKTAEWDPVFHKQAVSRDQYKGLQSGDEVEVETPDGVRSGTVRLSTKSSVVVDWTGGDGVYDPDTGEVQRSARFSKELGHQVTVRGRRRGVSYEGQLGKWPGQAHLGRRIGTLGTMYTSLANQELSREYEDFLENADQLTYNWMQLEQAKNPSEEDMVKANSVVDALFRGYTNVPPIRLVRNATEYPLHLMQSLIGDGAHGVRGLFDNHTVYVDVGSALEAVKEGQAENLQMAIAETVLHEVVGHYGIRGFFGNSADLEVWTNRFLTAFPEEAIAMVLHEGMIDVDPELSSLEQRRAANRWLKNEATRADFLRVGEELIAYSAGRALLNGENLNKEQRTLLQRFFDWVRNWLVDKGWGRFANFNERQLMRVIADAQNFVAEGNGWSYYEIVKQNPVAYMKNGDMFQNSWVAEFNATREEKRGKQVVIRPVYPEQATAETYANTLRSRAKSKDSSLTPGMLDMISADQFMDNLTWGDLYGYAPESFERLRPDLLDRILKSARAEGDTTGDSLNAGYLLRSKTELARQLAEPIPKKTKVPREVLTNFMADMTPVLVPVDPETGVDIDITPTDPPNLNGQLDTYMDRRFENWGDPDWKIDDAYREIMLVQLNPDPIYGDKGHWGDYEADATIGHARVGESILETGEKAYSVIELQHSLQGMNSRPTSYTQESNNAETIRSLYLVLEGHAYEMLDNWASNKSMQAFVKKHGENWSNQLAKNLADLYPLPDLVDLDSELSRLDPLDTRYAEIAAQIEMNFAANHIRDAILRNASTITDKGPSSDVMLEAVQRMFPDFRDGGLTTAGVFSSKALSRELFGSLYSAIEASPANADKVVRQKQPVIGGVVIPSKALDVDVLSNRADPLADFIATDPFAGLLNDGIGGGNLGQVLGQPKFWVDYRAGSDNVKIWMTAPNEAELQSRIDSFKSRLVESDLLHNSFQNYINDVEEVSRQRAYDKATSQKPQGRYLYLHSELGLDEQLDAFELVDSPELKDASIQTVGDAGFKIESSSLSDINIRRLGSLPTAFEKETGEPLRYRPVLQLEDKTSNNTFVLFEGEVLSNQSRPIGLPWSMAFSHREIAEGLIAFYESNGEEPNFNFPIRHKRYMVREVSNRPNFYAAKTLPTKVTGKALAEKIASTLVPMKPAETETIDSVRSQLTDALRTMAPMGSEISTAPFPVTPLKATHLQKALINYTLFDAVRRGYKYVIWGGGEYSSARGGMQTGYSRNDSIDVHSFEYTTNDGAIQKGWKIVPSNDSATTLQIDDSKLDPVIGYDVAKIVREKGKNFQSGAHNHRFTVRSTEVRHPIMVAYQTKRRVSPTGSLVLEQAAPYTIKEDVRLIRGGREIYDKQMKNTINKMVKDLGGKVEEVYLDQIKSLEGVKGPAKPVFKDEWEKSPLVVKEVSEMTGDKADAGTWAWADPGGFMMSDKTWNTETAAQMQLARHVEKTAIAGYRPRAYAVKITDEMKDYYSKGGRPLAMRNRKGSSVDSGLEDLAEKYFAVSRGPTLVEQMQDWKANWKRHATMGVFDKLSALKEALEVTESSIDPYKAARLATGLDVIMTRTFEAGYPEWQNNVITHQGGKGLFQILEPVQNQLQEWGWYMAARRAEVLMGEGRENLMEPEDIKRFKALGEEFPVFETVAKEYAEFNKKVLDFAEESGIIDPETRAVWDHHEYVPFYRVQDDRIQGALSPKMGIANQSSPIRRLSGGTDKLGDIVNNITANYTKLIDASIKNHAALMAVDELQGSGFMGNAVIERSGYGVKPELIPMSEVKKVLQDAGVDTGFIPPEVFEGLQKMFAIKSPVGKPGYFQVMRNGRAEIYYADPTDPLTSALFESLTMIDFKAFGKIFNTVLTGPRWFKRFLTGAITLDPGFTIRNYLRDMLSARITSGERYEPITGAARGLATAITEGEDLQKMMSAGAAFESGYLNYGDPESTHRAIRRSMRSASFRNSVLDTPAKIFQTYRHGLSAAENASRIAIYRAVKKRGGSDLDAAYESKDIMDFSMSGNWGIVQFLIQTVPFMNARLQGLYRLGRGFSAYPASVIGYGSLLGFATIALLLSYDEDDQERYDALEDWDKDAYYHFWIPINGEMHHFRLPKPFEIGAIFSTIPERALEFIRKTKAGEHDAYRTVLKSFGHMFSDTFAMDPTPQIIKPMMEVSNNKNSFTERDIVTYFEKEGRTPNYRYRYYTSPSAIALAQLMPDLPNSMWPESIRTPLALEHLWRGYTGTLGGYFLQASDALVRAAMNKPDIPERAPQDMPVIGSFWRGTSPRRTKYEQGFYDVLRQSMGAQGSINFLEKTEQDEQAELLENKYGPWTDVKAEYDDARSEIKEINDEMLSIYNDLKTPPEKKREELDKLQREKNSIFKELYELRPGGSENPIEQALLDQSPSKMLGFETGEVVRFMQKTDRPTMASLVESMTTMSPKDRETLLR